MIDRNLYSQFRPLLYQVASGGLNPGDVSYWSEVSPPGGGAGVSGDLAAIDERTRRIKLADGRGLTSTTWS